MTKVADEQPAQPSASAAPVRASRLKRFLPALAVLLVVVLAAGGYGGYGGYRWYKHYQANQKEKHYQAVVDKAKASNKSGKYKDTKKAVEDYLRTNPEQKYRAQPTMHLGMAYMNERNYDKAGGLFEQVFEDPAIPAGDRKAMLSALIAISTAKGDKAASVKYLEAMLKHLDERASQPGKEKFRMYYATEKYRYEQILKDLRSKL